MMINDVDWDRCRRRHSEFWRRENHDRPLLWVTAPRNGAELHRLVPHQPTQNNLLWISGPFFYADMIARLPAELAERWLDTGSIIRRLRRNLEATYFAGEAFPLVYPDLGADIMGALLGCPLELGENTTWCKPAIEDWGDWPQLCVERGEDWWKLLKGMTRELASDARGDYFVATPDIHPGIDTLVAMRGPERLCLDLYDRPETVLRAVRQAWDAFTPLFDELLAICAENLGGSSNWMGAWHQGKWHTVSADFMTMISDRMFERFLLPEILEEVRWLDTSLFHLDGPDALRHLEMLLAIPELSGIAWLPGAGKPPVSQWLPQLKRIQQAGKLIQAEVHDWELPRLLQELAPEGVIYITSCRSEEKARDLLALAERSYRKTLY
jgi:hypothetical protein